MSDVCLLSHRTLERIVRQHQRYGAVNLLFQTLSEDSSLLLLLAHQRIKGFVFMYYINPRLTLQKNVYAETKTMTHTVGVVVGVVYVLK